MDENYPILLTVTETDLEGNENHLREKEETTMRDYWSETQLDDSGMDQAWYAQEYDNIYNGQTITWWSPHDSGDPDETLDRTDYYAEDNGDENTVTHPVSGGSMRVTR
jgi:hypothetical protein